MSRQGINPIKNQKTSCSLAPIERGTSQLDTLSNNRYNLVEHPWLITKNHKSGSLLMELPIVEN